MKNTFLLIFLFVLNLSLNAQVIYDTITVKPGVYVYLEESEFHVRKQKIDTVNNSNKIYDYYPKKNIKNINSDLLIFVNNNLIKSHTFYEENIIVKYYYNDNRIKYKYILNSDYIHDGFYYEFYKNGILKTKGKYCEGNKCDYWIEYNELGELISKGKYKIIKVKEKKIFNYLEYINEWHDERLSIKKGIWLETKNGDLIEVKY